MSQVYVIILYHKELPDIITIKVGCSKNDMERPNKVIPQIYKFWESGAKYLNLKGSLDENIIIESMSITFDKRVNIEKEESEIRKLHITSEDKKCLLEEMYIMNTPFDYKFKELFNKDPDFDIDLVNRNHMVGDAKISGVSELFLIDKQILDDFKNKLLSKIKNKNILEVCDVLSNTFKSFDKNKLTYKEYFNSVPEFKPKETKTIQYVSKSGRISKPPKRNSDMVYYG